MGSCIICGKSVDGSICEIHEEDVVFEFRGDHPGQLTTGRYYRGSVDGFAEFGVFVDIGDRVTGLLHRSELDRRLDNLDWDPGETVYVQVTDIRDNGNVDLGWSIRQSEREFRGALIDDPDRDHAVPAEQESDATDDSDASGGSDGGSGDASGGESEPQESATRTTASVSAGSTEVAGEDGGTAAASGSATVVDEPTNVTVDALEDHVGEAVRVEGEITGVRQTSGPTVFELRDETGTIDCAAFEEAGVRAYPGIDTGDVVRLDGEVERRRGELQIETTGLVALEGDSAQAVVDRMENAVATIARPDAVDPVAPDPAVETVGESIRDVATEIRRAVIEGRPVVVRHSATADGYVAGVAIERATLPLVRNHHDRSDAEYHYFDRRPVERAVYDMGDATTDVTRMLDDWERHDEKYPLFVFVAAGGTRESLDGFDLLDVYGARQAVVDTTLDDPVAETAEAAVSPGESAHETTATALATGVAVHVNEDVRADLAHLPAVSYWEDTPDAYADAAADAGYDADAVREIREAVALEAYYHSYEDKRELITDLLFGDEEDRGLAAHVSEQFRTKLDRAVETAEANLERRTVGDREFALLDAAAFTHRFDFPPIELLVDDLFRRHREEVDALVGVHESELHLRTDADVPVRTVGERVDEAVSDAGLDVRSAREGRLEFLAGERDAVREAVVETVADLA